MSARLFKRKEAGVHAQEANRAASVSQGVGGGLVSLVRNPHISEKSSRLAERNQYVFRVDKGSTKPQIKRAVEKLYNVKVRRVAIVSLPGKVKRLGRTEGFRPGLKKAIVTLREGKIEFT